jgi:serine/threonine protein phosphatase 1
LNATIRLAKPDYRDITEVSPSTIRELLNPVPGTNTDKLWVDEYPVWVGADKGLSESPRRHPSKVQVAGHVQVVKADVNDTRIRLDTSGGSGTLTGCLLRSAVAEPVFLRIR